MRKFWEQFIAGVIDAMGGESSEPFGVWPQPPLPKPLRWAKRKLRDNPEERKYRQ